MSHTFILPKRAIDYLSRNQNTLVDLVIQLATIPAPSTHEELRMVFCRDWLLDHGVKNVEVDDAFNVICPFNCEERYDIHIFMAHMDTVFPDMSPLKVIKRDGKIFAPGVGDNTANLAVLLMMVSFVSENPDLFKNTAVLFVANTCEEGLGNLMGCKTILKKYAKRIKHFISFDGYINHVTNSAVGSERYKIAITTQGGHSYNDFGHQNAIVELARIINKLYAIEVPGNVKTTYNVGMIEGGTSINTIAESASMMFEYRSEDPSNLELMRSRFLSVLDQTRSEGISIETILLDCRPCKAGINDRELDKLTSKNLAIIRQYYLDPVKVAAASTDANVPLSMGIPANTLGTVIGDGAHTHSEWILEESLETGFKISITILCEIAEA